MNEFIQFIADWLLYIVFTAISLFRIIRWLIPDQKWGRFHKYVPYRTGQRYLALITAIVYIGYLIIISMTNNHAVSTKIIRSVLIAIWVVTLMLPDKQYELGMLTMFGFKPNNNK